MAYEPGSYDYLLPEAADGFFWEECGYAERYMGSQICSADINLPKQEIRGQYSNPLEDPLEPGWYERAGLVYIGFG